MDEFTNVPVAVIEKIRRLNEKANTTGVEPLKLTGEERPVQQQKCMDNDRRAFLEAEADERKIWRCDFKFRPEEAVMFEDFVCEAFMFMIRRSGKGLYSKPDAAGIEKGHEKKEDRGRVYGMALVLATETMLDTDGRTPRALGWCVYRT